MPDHRDMTKDEHEAFEKMLDDLRCDHPGDQIETKLMREFALMKDRLTKLEKEVRTLQHRERTKQ